MIKPMFVAAWFACCALLVIAPEGAVASAVGVQPQKPAVRDTDGAPARHVPPASPDTITVVLLGTGVGPPVNLQQYGPSTLVEAGGQRLLFDCGRGATFRLKQVGVPLGSISRVFLTHLHSDHIIQLPDLLLAGWVAGRHAVPLEVWGPAGTRAMMDHLQQAFAFDIHMRRAGEPLHEPLDRLDADLDQLAATRSPQASLELIQASEPEIRQSLEFGSFHG